MLKHVMNARPTCADGYEGGQLEARLYMIHGTAADALSSSKSNPWLYNLHQLPHGTG